MKAAAACLLLCACNAFSVVDDLHFGSGGAGAETTTTGGNGGTGGVVGMGGAGASTGGAGGGPGTCGVIGGDGCADGYKCSVVEKETGALGCVPAGPRAKWQRCDNDSDCGERLWCDVFTRVCHPLCSGVDECFGGESACVGASTGGSSDIPGLRICTSGCHPILTDPCNDGGGEVSCYHDAGADTWDCIESLGGAWGADCTSDRDCADGLFCLGGNTCAQWCTPVGETASCIFQCNAVNPAVTYGGDGYGVCDM
jgi:hypothetical protein